MQAQRFKHMSSRANGFTLIELLVVIAVSAVIAGGGFFSFLQYSRSQGLAQAVSDIILTYDEARNNAISNVKPINEICTEHSTLIGYEVVLGNDSQGSYYGIDMICLTADTATDARYGDKVYLPPNVRITGGIGSLSECSGVRYAVITANVTTGTSETTIPCSFDVYHEADQETMRKTITIAQDGMVTVN